MYRRFPAWVSAVLAVAALSLTASWAAHAAISDPAWLTAQSAGGTNSDSGRAITVTGDGQPVVVGTFSGAADFPRSATQSITLTSQGFGSAAFVAGLDAEAEYFTWALRIAGSSFEIMPTAVTSMGSSTPTASDDTILVTGYFTGTAYFPTGPTDDDSVALTAVGHSDGFIASVVPDGSRFVWARQISPSSSGVTPTRPRAITVDAAGRATIFGEFSTGSTLDFPTAGAPIGLPGRGTYTLFVARFAAETGYFDWAQRNLGTPAVYVTGGAQAGAGTPTQSDDRPLVSGTLNPGVTYFPTGRPAPDDSIAITGSDAFVAAMNADDSYFAWVQGISGTGGPVVASRANGRLVLAGTYTGTAYFPRGPGDDSMALSSPASYDAFVAETNADDSYFHSAVSAGGSGTDQVRAVSETTDGVVIVAGTFQSPSMSFPAAGGPITIANAGGTGAFVAQVGAAGVDFDWVVSAAGTTGPDSATPYGVAAVRDQRAVIAGQFAGTVTFLGAGAPLSLTSGGSNDVMVASVGASAPEPSPPPPAPTPASAPRDASAVAGDASASVSWSAPASAGSFPVTNYQVTSSPGGRICLTSGLSCEVAGLANGTAYTFTVKALTGAGWSPASDPSNAVTPVATPRPTITITGAREGKRITVTGSTTGMGMGGLVTPWASRIDRTATPGKQVELSIDGAFTWSRLASPRVPWSVYFAASDGVRSNTVRIAVR